MTTKESLLSLLESNRGAYISGEIIAEKLCISRAAVWKAIDALRKNGFIIDAQTNKGYALAYENDKLSLAGIAQHLSRNSGFKIELYDNVTSTNDILRGKAGDAEGLVIVANNQTAGIGRMGRVFYSPAQTGIYFSILLKPTFPSEKATFLTTMAGVAVCRAIEHLTAKKPKIKWVNDIFIDGKKVCGILTQASFSLENSGLEYAVLGIGINAYEPKDGFAQDVKGIAGAVLEKPQGDFKNKLLANILNEFELLYKQANFNEIAKEYKDYSLVIGKEITVIRQNEQQDALAVDIDEDCRLIVEYKDKRREVLSSNEISIRGLFE